MQRLKCKWRLIASMLLLCILVSSLPCPALALPPSEIQDVPEVPTSTGRLVALVRLSASSGSTAIGCLEDGTHITVFDTKNHFYRIDCYDMTGYIAISQVKQSDTGEYYISCDPDSPETKTLQTATAEEALALRGQIRTESLRYQGVPYVWGGTTPNGFDCSGFTQYVFNAVGSGITRSCASQLQDGVIIAKEDLQCGDLIFFKNTTGYTNFVSHVGIYIGNGQLIHAGSRGITVVDLENAYFEYHYMCARRVILSDVSDLADTSVIPGAGITQNINGSYWRESSQTDTSGNSFLFQHLHKY